MKKTYLYSTGHYSITTSSHQSCVRRSIPHEADVFDVPNVLAMDKNQHEENLVSYAERVTLLRRKATRARISGNRDRFSEDAEKLTLEAAHYAKRFKLVRSDGFGMEKLTLKVARTAKKRREEAEEQERKRVERAQVQLRAWLRGKNQYFPCGIKTTYLRVVKTKDGIELLQTSLRAEIPMADAKRAYDFVKLCREKKRDWRRNGEQFPVGQFQLDSVSASGNVIAGCHDIHWDEIKRFAKIAGWK